MAEKRANRRDRLRSIASLVALSTALILPAVSLVPLGGLWLWQNDVLLVWAIAAVTVVGAVYAIERWFLRRYADPVSSTRPPEEPPSADWTPAEKAAWTDVQAVAAKVSSDQLTSVDGVLDLGRKTVEAVARRLHPEVKDPVWQFTLPEALTIAERVSRRLGRFTLTSLPLSDRLTVAQVLALYRWRGAVGMAERAYDIWRLVRLANPVTAATQELRERLARQMLAWGQAHVTQRLAKAYVEEVGRAAIDLYGGRLRLPYDEPTDIAIGAPSMAGRRSPRVLLIGRSPDPIAWLARILGVTSGGTPPSPVLTVHLVQREGLPIVRVMVAPAMSGDVIVDALRAEAVSSDLVVWTITEDADLARDRQALDLLLGMRSGHPPSRPALLVLHACQTADRLTNDILASHLRIGPEEYVALARSNPDVEHAWARIGQVLSRMASDSAGPRGGKWRNTAKQTVRAAGALARALRRR